MNATTATAEQIKPSAAQAQTAVPAAPKKNKSAINKMLKAFGAKPKSSY